MAPDLPDLPDAAPAPDPAPELTSIEADGVTWHVDVDFLASRWTCLWGRGCVGIEDEPTPELERGCCSVGVRFVDGDEARTVAALAAVLDPERFEHHAEAAADGVFADPDGTATRVVDGACIFLNRPGFAGGAGCALHLGALDDGERPMDWKPTVCWQLPLHVDWGRGPDGGERATVRRWGRADWGPGGETMAWCCTEGDRAYVGDEPVIDALADELDEVLGAEVRVELRRRLVARGEVPAAPGGGDE